MTYSIICIVQDVLTRYRTLNYVLDLKFNGKLSYTSLEGIYEFDVTIYKSFHLCIDNKTCTSIYKQQLVDIGEGLHGQYRVQVA